MTILGDYPEHTRVAGWKPPPHRAIQARGPAELRPFEVGACDLQWIHHGLSSGGISGVRLLIDSGSLSCKTCQTGSASVRIRRRRR